MVMVPYRTPISAVAPQLLAVLLLLGWSKSGSAAGKWSVISLAQKTGEVSESQALAADAAGNLYVADKDDSGGGRIQRRDTQGNWSVLAPYDLDPGQPYNPIALAADTTGNLYVAQHF